MTDYEGEPWGPVIPSLGSSRFFPKVDRRPPRGMWAPGDYFQLCRRCRQHFIGDKRAGKCADCAYETEVAK